MAEISSTLISGPFGSERVPVPELTAPAQGLGTSVVPDTEVLLDDAAMAAEPRFQGARQAREATANEVEPTVLETMSAGVDTWITTRMVDRYNRPSFDNDIPVNPHEFMAALPMDLSEDEREYILSMATGEQAAMYAVSKVRDLRKAHDTLGKSPIVGLLTTFADPLMWTVPPALRIGSLAGRAGRAASAVSSAGLAAGMTALGEGPVTDDEIMLSGIMSGAVAGVVFKGGKLVKADPDFPDEVLNAKVNEVRSALETKTITERRLVQEEVTEEFDIPEAAAIYEDVEVGVPAPVVTSKPKYGYRQDTYDVEFSNPLEKAAYIIAGKGKSKAHAEILAWAQSVSGLDEANIIARGQAIREALKAQAKLGTSEALRITPDMSGLSFKPQVQRKLRTPAVPASKGTRIVSPAKWEDVEVPKVSEIRDTIQTNAYDLTGVAKAQENNTYKYEKGVRNPNEGFPQPVGTPTDKLFSNFASSPKEYTPKFREDMFARANKTPQEFQADTLASSTIAYGKLTYKVDAATSGNTRVQLLDGEELVAAARLVSGKIDSIASTKSGKGYGESLLRFINNNKLGNVAEVPDRSPGFVELQKRVLSSDTSNVPTLSAKPKPDLEEAATIAETNIAKESKARGLGEAAQWNMRKTMSSFGVVGKKVADLIFDNNSDLSKNSLESIREAELSNLRTHQYAYEDLLRNEMAVQGFGTFKQVNPMTSRQAYAKQLELEKQLQLELFRRDQAARTGTEIPSAASPAIIKMADAVDANSKAALKNAKAAGVVGLEDVAERPGYLNRKWSSQAITDARLKLERLGLTADQAHSKITRLVGSSIRRANNMEKDLANKIGAAIVDRALRKGYFEDALFNAPAGEGQLKQLRDILKGGGMTPADIERALNVLRVESDDAGKATFAKHRMELDYKATVAIGDTTISITDLIDSRVTSILDQYNRKVATSTAFARMGLKKPSDIEALRTELSHDIADEAKRGEAIRLFDNTIAYLRGEPSGATLNENFRLFQAYGRSISLAWSGLWQATEYATAMGEYGLLKTLKYAAQELPGLRTLMNNPKSAGQLNDVLAGHSMQSLRLRPYLTRYEDGFEMTKFSAAQLSAQTVGDLVPMANAMKYVHHHQANMVGNLILDRVKMAADGSADARKALATYGLEAPVMDRLAAEIKKHGFTVDAWDDVVWRDAQPSFAKMMDSAVLKERLGDVPAFAKFDDVGKILFTYRSFVLTAHNKVLAGTLARGGAGAVGLIMMYQFPLAMMAVQAQSLIKGDGALDDKDLAKRALGQMGGLGLFSEPIKWATGESNSVGAPILIPVDRAVRLFQSATNADAANASSTAITMLPVVAAVPFIRGVANQIKE